MSRSSKPLEKRKEKNWILTCTFPMRIKNSSSPAIEIKIAKQLSHI
jgi:hypothetical protein